ncbi:MAG TPA: CoA-binding protein [Moraxellaceae bacterium]|nr:CoA-binding protein [Moraxellaceae bacterium]
MTETVAVLGASPKPERYSNKAIRMLREYGHTVLPVNPAQTEIEGLPVTRSIASLPRGIDTVTVYVSPAHSTPLLQSLLDLHPARVIFNPGAENDALEGPLRAAGIEVEEACTLVLLRTGQFDR